MVKAKLYKKLRDNNLQCQACSHYCLIEEGSVGICGVRKNIGGDLFLLVYGRPAAVQVDPIEKKPLYHFLPKTKVLSLGTFGCNFRCGFCQNYELSQTGKLETVPQRAGSRLGGRNWKLGDANANYFDMIEKWSPERLVSYAVDNQIPSIAYTYNEPAIFVEYARDIMVLAKKKGLKNVYVSNGYESKEAIEYIGEYLDAANIDLKSFKNEFYAKICGGRLLPVLDTIKRMYKRGIHLEITTLVIPGENDNEAELKQIAEFIANVDREIPWHLSRFFPMYQMMDHETTPIHILKRVEEVGRKAGLKYVYLGNI